MEFLGSTALYNILRGPLVWIAFLFNFNRVHLEHKTPPYVRLTFLAVFGIFFILYVRWHATPFRYWPQEPHLARFGFLLTQREIQRRE